MGLAVKGLINYRHLKLWFRMYLKECFCELPFVGSTSFQIPKKLKKLFTDKLTFCNLKIVFMSPVTLKDFFIFKVSYVRYYFQDLFTSISVVAAMLPIMVRPNAIFKSKFVKI